jgi:IS5 family transposase
VSHPQRKTIGLRVPDHKVLQELLECTARPLLATTLIPPARTEALNDAQEIRERFEKQIGARDRCRRLPAGAHHRGRPLAHGHRRRPGRGAPGTRRLAVLGL